MRKFKLALVVCTAMLVFTGCQKNVDNDSDLSDGTLKSSITGECEPVTVFGIFRVNENQTTANYVDVQVNVSSGGSFDVSTDTINGYSFHKTGLISAGINTIRLYPSGTPLVSGVDIFTVTYGTTFCSFSIVVFDVAAGGALFTLGGSPGNCAVNVVNGVYQVARPMDASNTVEMTVNVTSIGTYTIAGAIVNGISFSGSGSFINPGVQNVILTATGTPAAAGTFVFPVNNVATTCSFSLPVIAVGANADYVPQTSYSNWSYKTVGGAPGDTAYVHILPNSIVINSNTYRIFETVTTGGVPSPQKDSFYYRKSGGKYYYIYNDAYGFDGGFNADGLLLDSSLPVNASWVTFLGNDTWGGLPATGSIKVTILAKGASAVIAGNSFNSVIKAEYLFRYNTGAGDVAYMRWEHWYAKGIGVIYSKYNDIPVTATSVDETIRYKIY